MTAPTARGIDHIGLTVVDIEAAERFLIDGLGAEFIFETINPTHPPFKGPEVEKAIGVPPGTEIDTIRMYKMGTGPGIELFHYKTDGQRPAARMCDVGWQHLALYVDDMEAAIERAVAAGAEQLGPPWDLINAESGPGNRFCFLRAPFGPMIELVSHPSPSQYESETPLRRWKPPVA
ncbi:VOC family protein [Sphingomonas sp. SRS2]|uniref:VOC family protein n=1 Tax=Sphingomonas sp. SRS2 TaxID=133190 RepID=UPI0006184C91|nr:VOC family protein [Sphingomonas sp. SRS2]KKC27000.1 glyoxalase [Sphingomonas sp. SRS2]